MSEIKLYAERDIEHLDDIGGYYSNHVYHMTSEALNGKSAIAAELAFRDSEIARLKIEINNRADFWISVGDHPLEDGRYTVDSSYGVRDAFFSNGFIVGDFRWQDCQTGNDEGMQNCDGVEFEVYNWMPLPQPLKVSE